MKTLLLAILLTGTQIVNAESVKKLYLENDWSNTITCVAQQLCDIALINGDANPHWIITLGNVWNQSVEAKKGYIDDEGAYHMIIMATDVTPKNRVIVTTDHYQYKFNMEAVAHGNITSYAFITKPTTELTDKNAVIDNGLHLDFKNKTLDTKYDFSGDTDSPIKPIQVFNDGKTTYFEMPGVIENITFPVLFGVSESGGEIQLNPVYRRPYWTVTGVLPKYLIKSGSVDNDNQVKIYIIRQGIKRKHWFNNI